MYTNTRRGGANNQNQGRRSGAKPTNFVPGGQLTPQRGGIQQQPQKQATGGPTAAVKQQAPQTPTKPVVSNPAPLARQAPATPVAPAPTPIVPPSPIEQKPFVQNMETQNEETQNGEKTKDTEKKSWMNRKIPKKERIRRRNVRLSKLLQPKNALMILNELVKNPTFNVVESQGQYKAVLAVAGVEHVGYGKSKACAKNVASENAIKHLLKSKRVGPMEPSNTDEDGDEKMDTFDANESPADAPLPWQQVASFALYKLFDSWGENPTFVKEDQPKKVTPARKMPENPASINPIMLVNQMYPESIFDDLPPVGATPNIVFKVICNIDNQSFEGTGSSKKAAKKQAAYAACTAVLGISYPPEEYTPTPQQ